MAANLNNIRIIDIANKANVSAGTVDRVIHNRGKVSKRTHEIVQKVIDELQYKPNTIAQALAMKKERIIYVLIPYVLPGEYWEIVNFGIDKAQEELEVYGTTIKKIFYDQYRVETFIKCVEELKQINEMDGVVIATHFPKETCLFADWLFENHIPYVFINIEINHDNYLAYFGHNSYVCGQIFARLCLELMPPESNMFIFNIHGKRNKKSSPVSVIENGFWDYLKEVDHEKQVLVLEVCMKDRKINSKIDAFINKNPQVKIAVVFNSRAYYLAEYLESTNNNQIKILGLDLLKRNVDYLKKGQIKYLLSQKPETQCYNALKALSNYLIFKTLPERKMNYTPIDILIKENVDYYL